MASSLFSNHNRQQSSTALLEKLSSVLPRGFPFGVFHLSTPPTKTTALCHPPPGERPDRTYCEKHFLAITVDAQPRPQSPKHALDSPGPPTQVLVLSLEIYIFTTAYSSTFFVSKADSTGYLHLLNLPKDNPSPIREISSAFVTYLVEQRRRKNIQSVVSLFARSQSQYLFPGSVDNSGKHVLDDRGLVKWWCRVLNPLLESQQPREAKDQWGSIRGYLIVPGLDHYETRAFIPRSPVSATNWAIGHPLEQISHYCQEYDWVPPRCLIPKYPDDPKSRFRDELDEEASKWKQDMGSWKSVKTLEQFWEMMAFRQECSSGRLTGFIWVVFNPKSAMDTTSPSTQITAPSLPTPHASFDSSLSAVPPATPPRRLPGLGTTTPQSSPMKHIDTPSTAKSTPPKPKQKKLTKKKALKGRIVPRQPHVKTHQRNYLADRPLSTAYYHWPSEGRGQKLVDESDYKRSTELLLRMDFATLEKAVASTRRWIGEVGMGSKWGLEVVGKREVRAQQMNGTSIGGTVNNLAGLVKRKRVTEVSSNGEPTVAAEEPANKVNLLGAGLVRKKRKDEGDQASASSTGPSSQHGASSSVASVEAPQVNVLRAGLVRKKPKTS